MTTQTMNNKLPMNPMNKQISFYYFRNEDFLETVPKAKLRRVQWMPMFNCLKQGILDEMIQELSSMWEYENMRAKIEVLDKQKEKFAEIGCDKVLWLVKVSKS